MEQVVDEPGESLAVPLCRVEQLRGLRGQEPGDTAGEKSQCAADRGGRRAERMSDNGGELSLYPFDSLRSVVSALGRRDGGEGQLNPAGLTGLRVVREFLAYGSVRMGGRAIRSTEARSVPGP